MDHSSPKGSGGKSPSQSFRFSSPLAAAIFIAAAVAAYTGAGAAIVPFAGVPTALAGAARTVVSPYLYDFHVNGTLDEAGDETQSTSPYWYLNSGGAMTVKDGIGKTIQGNLPPTNKWRTLYAAANPRDTDNGAHPQNILRLVSRNKWNNFQQEAYFKINKDNFSASEYRNESNGLLLFNRYKDSQNLYYAGIRVDGTAVIKRKQASSYQTLVQNPVFPNATGYNRASNPNVLPHGQWIGIRTIVKDEADGSVHVQLFMDQGKTGTWKLIAETRDKAANKITGAGYGGIRTDFMDVEIDNFRMISL